MIEIKRLGEDKDPYEAVRISSIPEPMQTNFRKWLSGQTLPIVDGTDNPFDWAYAWDWWRFCRQ